jgi:cysteine desulfurase family protein
MELRGEDERLIYLDNAATSFPKPREVTEAVEELMLYGGGNAGRGSHKLALKAAEKIFECREKLSSMFEADGEESVCFTLNTTYALNTCIKGILKKGDHVLISDLEHNAVWRPIHRLWERKIIEYDIFPSFCLDKDRNAAKICEGISRLVRKNTRMLICTGASNICSAAMPLGEIGALCRRLGIVFVVDGAQCAGHTKISLRDMHIDALCIPAHKGLLGPQGCGAVIFGKQMKLECLVEGGNGVASLEADMPDEAPERYEAGTLPTPAIAGLCAGLDIVSGLGTERIEAHEKKLFRIAAQGLRGIERVKIYLPEHEGSVLLFNIDGMSSETVAAELAGRGICVRGGYHCAAISHKTLGTLEGGGVRVSFGPFNSSCDVEMLCEAVENIVKSSGA